VTAELRVSGVSEQSVDLLLWEELVASPEFLAWFLAEAEIPELGVLAAIERSVNTVNGESDLEIDLRGGSTTMTVLIENKIDAPLQPLQAARYRERAAAYVQQHRSNSALTVLVAPSAYFGDSETAWGSTAV